MVLLVWFVVVSGVSVCGVWCDFGGLNFVTLFSAWFVLYFGFSIFGFWVVAGYGLVWVLVVSVWVVVCGHCDVWLFELLWLPLSLLGLDWYLFSWVWCG